MPRSCGIIGGMHEVEAMRYGDLLWVLRQYEGWRCLWRAAFGVCLRVLTVLVPVVAAIASAYIVPGLHWPFSAALPAAVGLVGADLVRRMSRRRLWRVPLAGRLRSFLEPAPGDVGTVVLVRKDDFPSACLALRRAKLTPARSLLVGVAPDDAPDLDTQIWVVRPPRWHASERRAVDEHVRHVLGARGIRGRSGGRDVRAQAHGAVSAIPSEGQ
jgi:hypothetical protein